MQLSICLPCLEPEGPELCFLSHPESNLRLQCHMNGNLSMAEAWRGWEVWRFARQKDGTFVISSWTHMRFLCTNSKGEVYSKKMEHKEETDQVQWRIQKHDEHGLVIQSAQLGSYLESRSNKLGLASEIEGRHAVWETEPGHNHQFFLTAVEHDRRLSSKKDNILCTSRNRQAFEKWIVKPCADNTGAFTIRSLQHKHYLGSDEEGRMRVADEESKWALVSSPHGGVFLKHLDPKYKNLCCDRSGQVYLMETATEWETWKLEPIMPDSLSEKQLWTWVGIGVGSLAAAVTAPFMVVGTVAMLGFEAGGIAAGSAAAGMMSAEAIASGGAIAAGGTVATLQSIGAAGLGAAATAGCVGTGAVVTGGVATAVNHKNLQSSEVPVEAPVSTEVPPLCSWRHWVDIDEDSSQQVTNFVASEHEQSEDNATL